MRTTNDNDEKFTGILYCVIAIGLLIGLIIGLASGLFIVFALS